MLSSETSKSSTIRARLNHPVIDSDGHMIEFEPAVLEHLESVGGKRIVERFRAWSKEILPSWNRLSLAERRERRAARITWWGMPAENTLDRATASLPGLFYERLDELGIDFAVLYPTFGLPIPHLEDEELRKAVCRAFNLYYAEVCSEYADRLTPAAIIPMHTPQEAIEELEYAVGGLGLKASMFASHVRRPIAAAAKDYPSASRFAFWLDTYGVDSEYDYDPVWAKCVELGVAPGFHSTSFGWGSRTSVSNYIYNHIGTFSTAGEAVCKSLFLGGVTRRFPNLKFAFLEGGVAWACNLYADLISHWEKRNIKSLQSYNPASLDRGLLVDLYRKYGGKMVEGRLDQVTESFAALAATCEDSSLLDEWAACGIERAEDIRDAFITNFYFGCEADDRMNALAFNSSLNPLGAQLKILLGSDIGHWDVRDASEVLEEAFELVEDGLLGENHLRDFVFINPVSFYAGMNPKFFNGTVIEKEVESLRR
jgi:predicted TIM-barrel fold metal-dependent hydrolase